MSQTSPSCSSPLSESVSSLPSFAPEKAAQLLRDLFAARDGAAMACALEAMASFRAEGDLSSLPSRDEDSIREAEYAFNRLFVGPGPVPAPPYASVYLDAEPLLMGQAAVSMRELIRSLGLAVREEDNLPEDHLACELEVWLVLRSLAPAEDGGLRQSAEEALHWLLDGHMSVWIPEFLSRARAESMPELLSDALDCLEAWLLSTQQAPNRE